MTCRKTLEHIRACASYNKMICQLCTDISDNEASRGNGVTTGKFISIFIILTIASFNVCQQQAHEQYWSVSRVNLNISDNRGNFYSGQLVRNYNVNPSLLSQQHQWQVDMCSGLDMCYITIQPFILLYHCVIGCKPATDNLPYVQH